MFSFQISTVIRFSETVVEKLTRLTDDFRRGQTRGSGVKTDKLTIFGKFGIMIESVVKRRPVGNIHP